MSRSLSIKLRQKVVHVPACSFICDGVEPDETKTRLKRKQPGQGLDDVLRAYRRQINFGFSLRHEEEENLRRMK